MQPGAQVTARIDGKLRGCTVLSVDGDTVTVECYTPPRVERTLPRERVQLSADWNDPAKRREL